MSKVPILMYHNVSPDKALSHGLTISTCNFEKQLQYLSKNKYHSFFVSDIDNEQSLPKKSILLTFDDVTENQLLYAVPLLEKYHFKVTFFVPFSYVGEYDLWNDGAEKIMTFDQLKSLNTQVVQLAHHSFFHRKIASLTAQELVDDLEKSFAVIEKNNLKVYPAIAYPYGSFPKKNPERDVFTSILSESGIKMGFRIGNRINRFPIKNWFKLQRIDIKGHDSLLKFKLKLKFGKLKLF